MKYTIATSMSLPNNFGYKIYKSDFMFRSFTDGNHLLVLSGWYFSIFAALSEIDNMSQTFLDLGSRPRALFNFLIIQGIFFPWTLITEKTPSKTAKYISKSYSVSLRLSKKLTDKNNNN